MVDSNCHLQLKLLYFRDSVGTSDIIHFAQNRYALLPCGTKEVPWFDIIVALQEGKEDCSFGIKYVWKM